jgi:hypothetical protein
MNAQAIFGFSALSSLVASSVAAALWMMPNVQIGENGLSMPALGQ